ncbi:P-loop containing nucleoside triphosphate hydrolase protein [Cercophora samala]|uniref:P-loop containing nucleoside triphosphate hydrolase protein n=1 Tax=Cercophora samala TaxID=330535 RepID=A0AA39ZBG1_9PEZI|nr:P-loop containing nucleoside triphosphate hydrolase protein [Cercophora samala]
MSATTTRSATPCGSEPDEIVDDSGVQVFEDDVIRPSSPSSGSHKDSTPETPPELDNSVVVQKLYEIECCCGRCASRLSKHVDVDQERTALEAEVSNIPIIQRHPGPDEHVTSSITINCPLMRDILTKALENYYQDPDTLTAENWTFNASFKPLVHRWKKINEIHESIQALAGDGHDADEVAARKKASNNLIAFLTPLLESSITTFDETLATGRIRHKNLWQIFPAGELVVTKFFGVETLCRVSRKHTLSSDDSSMWVMCEYVDWNGRTTGMKGTWVTIKYFKGRQKVTGLEVYPLSMAVDPEGTKARMLARGKRWEGLRGYRYQQYKGHKIAFKVGKEEDVQITTSGRVVIDHYAYYQSEKKRVLELGPLDNEQVGPGDSSAEEEPSGSKDEMTATIVKPETSERVDDSNLPELSDEHRLLTTPWLIGFDLKAKDWARYCIDNLQDIEWNDTAFDNLVSKGGEKQLAWEFVASKKASIQKCDDFVAEKGRGITILMFGPPGVGKTFTAEAVAERARVPLYLVSAGVLSTTPSEVEAALDHALNLCRLWNAMLLLDEADVFLGARSDEGLVRNELVSIFLTKLEYYQGILFLTTNRFSAIDHAFQSRVDLFLPYYDLDSTQRRQVWLNFFKHFGPDKFVVGETDLDRLCEQNMNGREIKNLCKTALLLSGRDNNGVVKADRLLMLAQKRTAALQLLGQKGDANMVGR